MLSLAKLAKMFSESDETRKTVSVCESKINSLKDRISKALRMTGFLMKSSKTFSPRCQNIMR